MRAQDQPLLRVEGLNLRYGDELVFSDLGFQVDKGSRILLQGPSGTGKSSLLRCMVDLEARAQSALYWKGRKVERDEIPSFRRQAIYVAQEPARSGGSALDSMRRAFSFQSTRDSPGAHFEEDKARALCRRIKIADSVLTKPLVQLSGGELRRVALVRALLLEPELLLVDEVIASLDSESSQAVCELLGELTATFIVISHDARSFASLVKENWTLDQGTLTQTRTRGQH